MIAALSCPYPSSGCAPRMSREVESALSHRDSVLGMAVSDSSRLFSWIHTWVSPCRKGLWFPVGVMGGWWMQVGKESSKSVRFWADV